MSLRNVRWSRAIVGGLVAEVAQIAAAFVWVAIYSYVINPGQPVAVYQQHAQDSGAWVSIFAGFVIFYYASKWIARSVATAMALFLVLVLIDGPLFVLMSAEFSPALLALAGTSYVTKALACYLGGRHAAAASRDEPA